MLATRAAPAGRRLRRKRAAGTCAKRARRVGDKRCTSGPRRRSRPPPGRTPGRPSPASTLAKLVLHAGPAGRFRRTWRRRRTSSASRSRLGGCTRRCWRELAPCRRAAGSSRNTRLDRGRPRRTIEARTSSRLMSRSVLPVGGRRPPGCRARSCRAPAATSAPRSDFTELTGNTEAGNCKLQAVEIGPVLRDPSPSSAPSAGTGRSRDS